MTKTELQEEIKELKEITNSLHLDKVELLDNILELENKIELKESKQNTYIHETNHLYCQDGELHIHYGDVENDNWLVWNTDSLYKDLHFIISQVVKENKKMQQMYLNNIKDSLKEM
jgi:hypothetical protein